MNRVDNIYNNLRNQISKISRHNRQGSYKTKERYEQGVNRFCKFLAEEYGIQKFANISDKHIEKYVAHMQERELSASTIKTDLASIRFYHDKVDKPRHTLSDNVNSKFTLERRSFGGVDRSWKQSEYRTLKEVCYSRGQDRIAEIATLARNEGLRIHEALRLDRATVEKALWMGELHVKGKGGKERDVLLTDESYKMLKERLLETDRGEKLYIQTGEETHLAIKQVQNFINRHRDKFQDEKRKQGDETITQNITFHGLRHTYAQEQYQQALDRNLRDYDARLVVSKLLGHERDDVTRIYTVK